MFYVAKFLQFLGLLICAGNFLIAFPHKMNYQSFFLSIFLFVFGWIIERFMLRQEK